MNVKSMFKECCNKRTRTLSATYCIYWCSVCGKTYNGNVILTPENQKKSTKATISEMLDRDLKGKEIKLDSRWYKIEKVAYDFGFIRIGFRVPCSKYKQGWFLGWWDFCNVGRSKLEIRSIG